MWLRHVIQCAPRIHPLPHTLGECTADKKWILGYKSTAESSGAAPGSPSSILTCLANTTDSSQGSSRKRKNSLVDGDLSRGVDSGVINVSSSGKRRRLSERPLPSQSFGNFYVWMRDVFRPLHRHSTTPGVCEICLSPSIHRSMYHHVMAEHIYPAMEATRQNRETPQELFVLLYYILIKSLTARIKFADFLFAHRDILPHTVAAETLISPRHAYPMLYQIARCLARATHEARKKRWACHCGVTFCSLDRLQKHITDEKTQNPAAFHLQRGVTFVDQRESSHSARACRRGTHSPFRSSALALLNGLNL